MDAAGGEDAQEPDTSTWLHIVHLNVLAYSYVTTVCHPSRTYRWERFILHENVRYSRLCFAWVAYSIAKVLWYRFSSDAKMHTSHVDSLLLCASCRDSCKLKKITSCCRQTICTGFSATLLQMHKAKTVVNQWCQSLHRWLGAYRLWFATWLTPYL